MYFLLLYVIGMLFTLGMILGDSSDICIPCFHKFLLYLLAILFWPATLGYYISWRLWGK